MRLRRVAQLDELLHGQESTLYGSKAYWTADDKALWEAIGGDVSHQSTVEAHRALGPHQRHSFDDTRAPQARISDDEALVRLRESAGPRLGEQHVVRLSGVCPRELVSAAP